MWRAEKETSGVRALSQSSWEAVSMSASRAADAVDHVNGKVPGRKEKLVEWASKALALVSKGSKRAVGLVSERAVEGTKVLCAANERLAKAERRVASRAGTGLIHPWSSVDPRLVRPAPVDASEPVQSRCCLDGTRG